ncbi:MAG: HD domain-containing phosphohydrolase [Fimbriimonadaceae bacterium]
MNSRIQSIREMRILVVDDEPTNLFLLERLLTNAGFTDHISCRDPRSVCQLCTAYEPDLIVLDLHMPGVSGVDVLHQIRPWMRRKGYLPVLVITADTRKELREEALRCGARDFLVRTEADFDETEAVQRISNLLETRLMQLDLEYANASLEQRIEERTAQIEAAQVEIVNRLGLACNLRDDQTGEHIVRVGDLCRNIAIEIGIDPAEAELIGFAARLHDIGKIGVADDILLKPGKLTEAEIEVMRRHTTVGSELLAGADSRVLVIAQTIALTHHERWDGTGYPAGLRGDEIPLPGRICAVADVFDSLTNDRPYKRAWPIPDAIHEIRRCRGTHFDPDIVDAFLRLQAGADSQRLAA